MTYGKFSSACGQNGTLTLSILECKNLPAQKLEGVLSLHNTALFEDLKYEVCKYNSGVTHVVLYADQDTQVVELFTQPTNPKNPLMNPYQHLGHLSGKLQSDFLLSWQRRV